MTGLYPHSHGITANVGELGCTMHTLPDNPFLLPRKLEGRGYSLGYVGKWHLCPEDNITFNHEGLHVLPCDFGFEGQNIPGYGYAGYFDPEYQNYLTANGYKHKVMPWIEKTVKIRGAGKLAGPLESTVPYFLSENTINLIDRFSERDTPFFIWHNFYGPHEDYNALSEFLDLYYDLEIPPWPNYSWPARDIPGPHHVKLTANQEELTWEDWAMMIRYYYAATSLIDNQIGRIINHLETTGLLDNTIIIFAADHGETLGSHGGLFDKGWHHFEETHRIPLIIRFPDGSHAGEVRQEFISLIDLYPTILELAGSDWDPQTIHGSSVMPLLRGERSSNRDYVVVEFGGVNNTATTQRTLRCGNIKYGLNISSVDELYDLEMDPYETRNLINHPNYLEISKELRELLAAWMEQTNDKALFRFKHQLQYYQ
jgi:arylsulfatase A-like enzyme